MMRRHEVFRTRFEVGAGEPAQVIDESGPRTLERADVSGMEEEREAKAKEQ